MCLIAIGWNVHPEYPLVLIANRDEFHARPTAPLAPWTDAPMVLGGRDLKEGGGWLALRRERRRLAAVTNVREPTTDASLRSRGRLVQNYIVGDDSAVVYAEQLRVDANAYGPFNLLLWDGEELILATNCPKPHWESVPSGLHGISNGSFDAPWPKTSRVMDGLQDWLDGRDDADIEPLFVALTDEQRAPDAELPDSGIGLERERMLSAPFIRLPGYGTRASSVVLVHRSGRTLFVERSFGELGTPAGERRFESEPL